MDYGEITLRALEPEDLELLYHWENEEAFWLVSNTITPFSRYTLRQYLENSHRNIYETGQLRLMIDCKASKVTIGTIDLFEYDQFHRRAGIGILIADAAYRRKGYATMALTCLISYCFNTLQLHQLWCNILEHNTESIELFKKQGFTVQGIKKDWVKSPGAFSDELFFQLIAKPDAG